MRKRNMRRTADGCSSGAASIIQTHRAGNSNPPTFTGISLRDRRVFICSSRQRRREAAAVLTIEAAVVIPLTLLAVVSLLGVLDLFRIQSLVRTSIHESAMELGMYAAAGAYGESASGESPVGAVSRAACILYADSCLPDLGDNVGISLWESTLEDDTLCLVARIRYRLPVTAIPLPAITVKNSSTVRCWVGRGREENEGIQDTTTGRMVYLTENSSVYHTDASCTHLDLAVHSASRSDMEKEKNEYGSRYRACEKCGGDGDPLYYTEKGDCYHSSASCSGLKRSVRMVEQDEAAGLKQCERCRMAEEAK